MQTVNKHAPIKQASRKEKNKIKAVALNPFSYINQYERKNNYFKIL